MSDAVLKYLFSFAVSFDLCQVQQAVCLASSVFLLAVGPKRDNKIALAEE